MANFKFIPGALPGFQNPMGIASTDNDDVFTTPFTNVLFPGIALFGIQAGNPWESADMLDNGERVIMISDGSINAIQYIHNNGFVNAAAYEDEFQATPSPYIDTICHIDGEFYRVLRVLDSEYIVISDPAETWTDSECWYANSRLNPNKKIRMNSEGLFNVKTIGGGSYAPVYNGVNYIFEAGDGINPIDILGTDSTTVNIVATK